MFWQYLVEIRLWFAILVAAALVGFGYGACWLLVGRPSRKHWARAERKAEARLGDTNRLARANSLLEAEVAKLRREHVEQEEELNLARSRERVLVASQRPQPDDATTPMKALDPAVSQINGQQDGSGGGSGGGADSRPDRRPDRRPDSGVAGDPDASTVVWMRPLKPPRS